MLLTMFCWETQGPGIYMDVTFTYTTNLNLKMVFAVLAAQGEPKHYKSGSFNVIADQ